MLLEVEAVDVLESEVVIGDLERLEQFIVLLLR